jgi:hypothetical protein
MFYSLGSILFSLLLTVSAQAATPLPTVIMVSGGDDMVSNDSDFIADIDRGSSVFGTFKKSVFYADGGDLSGPPNMITPEVDVVYPKFERDLPKTPVTGAAEYLSIRDQIKKIANEMQAASDTDSPIVLYFTDHGSFDMKSHQGTIELWNNVSMTEEQLRDLLSLIPDTHRVEVINDHCYGAKMADAFLNDSTHPRTNTCEVAAGSALELTSTGQGWMKTAKTMQDMKPAQLQKYDLDGDGYISAREVVSAMNDLNKMDSLPTTSSDTFAGRYLAKAQMAKPALGLTESTQCLDPQSAISQLIDNSLKPVMKAMLDRYTADLSVALVAANLPSTLSLQDLQKKIAQQKADLIKKMKIREDTGEDFGKAESAYIKFKMGKSRFQDYDNLVDQISSYEYSLDTATSDAEKNDFLLKLQDVQKKIVPYSTQANSIYAAIDEDNSHPDPGFAKFIQKKSEDTSEDFTNSVVGDYLSARKDVDSANDTLRPLLRISRDLTTLTALKNMSACGDTTAMNEYLGLLACENTPIFKVVHE